MNPELFAKLIQNYIVNENLEIYRDLYDSKLDKDSDDSYWRKASLLYDNLSIEHKEIFFEILRQVIVDTVSNFMGVLDGVCVLGEDGTEFLLTEKDQKCVLSGCLQDLFLEIEEKLRSK